MSISESPKKSQTKTTVTITRFSEYMMEQRENAAIHMDLKKCQADNENLKNVLISLDYKLHVHNAIKTDLEQNKKMLDKNESARTEL